MMDTTKSREEFEKWATEKFGDCTDISRAKNGGGGYMAWDVAFAWEAWQVSRESLEVELPAKITFKDTYWASPNKMREALVLSLRTAGIRIKGESE